MLHSRSRNILCKILTGQSAAMTAQQLSETYKVSPRTIRYDLEAIDGFLKENALPPLRRKGGISFIGDEEERTKALSLAEKSERGRLPDERIDQIIMALLQARGYTTCEEMAQMMDVSKNTVMNDLNKLREFYPYRTAAIEVTPRHGICFTGEEQDIRESVVLYMTSMTGKSNIHDIFTLIANGENYSKDLQGIKKALGLRIPDSAFIRIAIYLKVAYARIQSGHFILKTPSTAVNAAAELALSEAPKGNNREREHLSGLIDDYLSYGELTDLMIPFAEAANQQRAVAAKRANILVVCSAGLATSQLLCHQLTSLFDVNIVAAIDFNQLEDFNLHNEIDLIVSTANLGQSQSFAPSLQVSPFLTTSDLDDLKSILPTKVLDHNILSGLIKIIEDNCKILNPTGLMEGLAELLKIKAVSRDNLCDILPPENIVLDVQCETWQDAVIKAGEILFKNGYVEEAYIGEMVRNIEKNGPYIVVAKGIALPHAGMQSVKKVGMALLRLSNPVKFGAGRNDPVDLVFALCTPGRESHLEALKQFSLLVESEKLVQGVRKGTINEIAEIFAHHSQIY